MKHKKILSLLLVFALLAGMLPGMTLSAFAADKCEITVADSAPKTLETTQGAMLKVKLSDMFVDSEGHELSYALVGDYGTQTKIAANEEDGGAMYLYFTSPDAGTVDVQLKASCKSDPTVSATHTIAVTVKKGESGDAAQYGYDESPAETVKVYVTVSADGVPLVGNDGSVLAHLEYDVPYFDLENQELADFYRYHTENGSGGYVDDKVVLRPTLLHLYLMLLGTCYLGYDPTDVTSGTAVIPGHDGGVGVQDLNGSQPYDDKALALNITGSATSMYMQQFWGHDENLMYYRNHVYPLMSAGWGATADYILLSDGDTIDVAMFSNWSFWTYGAFAAFDQDDYTLAADGSVSIKTVKYDTRSVADGGTESFEPISGLGVSVYDENWKLVKAVQPDKEGGSTYTLDAAKLGLKAGSYYLLGMDPNASTEDACYAPATAKLVVKAAQAGCEHSQTETAFQCHSPKDGKFDENVTCKACGKVVSTEEHFYGDADGNGKFNAGEFQILLQHLRTGKPVLTPWQIFACDVNSDGKIDDDDVALISALGRNDILLPTGTQRAYVYYNQENGVDKHYVTITLPEYPNADLGGVYRLKEACADENGDGKCDRCGNAMAAAVPTRKADYPAESSGTVQTGMAYLLRDLQAGKIFEPVEGQTLNYRNYYFERSEDGGESWSARTGFSDALFGATTIQITENKAGTYIYRFYASHDGVHFSTDTWTLTLTVEDAPTMDFSFYVGKSYNDTYPIIKLYSITTDAEGKETLGDELQNVFLYSNFTPELPEGEEAYDPAQGKLLKDYQMFYAKLTAGRYAYRAFAKNAESGEYDVALGGMTLTLPTDTNVDGLTGGGTNIYLQCVSFYTSSRKLDNTYFSADEYHVRVDCPIMKCSTAMGEAYTKSGYAYYPTMLYAAGNACLYNYYVYPDIDGYIFTQSINQTFQANYRPATKNGAINTGLELKVTVPQDARFGLYFQWNNFNTTEIMPQYGDENAAFEDRWTMNEDGTKSAVYFVSKSNGNYTWRLSDDKHVTQAGWLSGLSAGTEMSFSFPENAPTNRMSHDFSNLGSATKTRDEADLQVNLDPSGFEAITGKTRVRAYRHWQLINSDAGNIMVEPDFTWRNLTLGGEALIETVNGGNTTANWADITPGAEDAFIAVSYESVDVNPGEYRSHGGLYPATNPERVGVIAIGGTGVKHGTADADVDFNMAPGVTTTRSMDWDYNYDTWFYNDNDNRLTFRLKATGEASVSYALVAFTADSFEAQYTQWTEAETDGTQYTIPLTRFDGIGNGKGGTVIIRMEDTTGVSYRLVRASRVTITAENVSNPGEDIMPGDRVKLSFSGMYRAVNKVSGIFNPTIFKPTYYAGETKFEGTLGQYQKMDNATVTVTIPEDVAFEDGKDTTTCTFTNGYTYGSMYSAANPFAFLYNMTDSGVGTNFNAVTVNYYMNHYADAAVTVSRKVTYSVRLSVPSETGETLSGVAVTLSDADGKTYEAENGLYTLGYGRYAYVLTKDGYVVTRGTFSLGSADAEHVADGVLTVQTAAMPACGENAWDGKTETEPQKDESGTYLIGTAAELAWFAKTVTGGQQGLAARLTADIELSGFAWTPIKKYAGRFDGDGHVIHNLYIDSTSYPVGLFGYLSSGALVTKLGVTGNVTCTARSNAQAGGIAGYLYGGAEISQCFSTVNVTSNKHAGGIAGYAASGSKITDCYATGSIATGSANECFLGGICGGASSYSSQTATMTNCYSIGRVTGSGGTASYIGGVSASSKEESYVNSYYLAGTLSGESPKYNVTGKGTAKAAEEMKALASTLGEHFAADSRNLNGGYPVLAWQNPAQPQLALGDVNGDGKIDNTDAALVYAYFNGKAELTEEQLARADVDGDGEISNIDAGLIYAFYSGKISTFPKAQ